MSGTVQIEYQYDRAAVRQRVAGRRAVFFDTMFWISMADGKPEALPLLAKLRERVLSGAIFCPLSPPLIWELYKQEHSMLRTGALMEELSLNVSFPVQRDVFEWEVLCFSKRRTNQEDEQCSRDNLFLPAIGYLASFYQVEYPPGWTEDTIKRFGQLLSDKLNSLTLSDILSFDGREAASAFYKTAPAAPFQNEAKFFQTYAKGDRQKVWWYEASAVCRSYILPAIAKLPLPLLLAHVPFMEAVRSGKETGRKWVEEMLDQMPALRNHIEVMTRLSEDPNRKDKPSDFYDVSLMPIPLAYADVFASQDRWVRERFMKRGEFVKRNKCEFYSTYSELSDWLVDRHYSIAG